MWPSTCNVALAESEDPSSFVPQNVPATGEWFWIDVPGMASALGLPPDTPLAEVSTPKPHTVAGTQACSVARTLPTLWMGPCPHCGWDPAHTVDGTQALCSCKLSVSFSCPLVQCYQLD